MQNSQQMGASQQATQFDARQPGAQSATAPQQTAATSQTRTVRFSDWAAI